MNYIGSKYSLIDFITQTVDKVVKTNKKQMVFADLFAGTGIVGREFKKRNYSIISNDIQYYSYVINKHYIENSVKLNNKYFDYLNNLKGKKGYIYKNYCFGSGSGRKYFTDENGMKCDAIRTEIDRLFKNNKITKKEYYYYLASLLDAIDKVANTASVYGAFLKEYKKTSLQSLKLTPLDIITTNSKCKVYNEDINILIKKIKGDILYLDPPYNERQYCSNYHVLETIALYDKPKISGKTGMRDNTDKKSKYCSKSFVYETFENLIANANFKYIFLSYNNEGLLSLKEIQTIMSKYGDYSVYTKKYRRYKADRNRDYSSNNTIEYLHCLIKGDVNE